VPAVLTRPFDDPDTGLPGRALRPPHAAVRVDAAFAEEFRVLDLS
jgi:hypothetical protein